MKSRKSVVAAPVQSLDDRTSAWIRISKAELPPLKLTALLEHAGNDPVRMLAAGKRAWMSAGLIDTLALRLEDWAKADVSADLKKLDTCGASIVCIFDPDYPQRLKELPDAPPMLYVRGTLHSDDQFSIAIVGSRRATAYGLSIAESFSRQLTANGLCVVSGGARGVDSFAHRGALDAGGRTIAVVGTGLDIAYPSENRRLYDEIVTSGQGAIISEYPFGATAEPWHFPERNRLIAGISIGTLVIESPVDSGAMITARDAADQGREVFAVPGPIELGLNSGCHKLIQEGAKLTQCVDDILDEIGILRLRSGDEEMLRQGLLPVPTGHVDPEHRLVLDQLSLQSRHVDQLALGCGLPAGNVIGILTMLELRGLARRVPGNAFVRVL